MAFLKKGDKTSTQEQMQFQTSSESGEASDPNGKKPKKIRIRTIIVVLVAIVLFVSCLGGGDTSDSDSAEESTARSGTTALSENGSAAEGNVKDDGESEVIDGEVTEENIREYIEGYITDPDKYQKILAEADKELVWQTLRELIEEAALADKTPSLISSEIEDYCAIYEDVFSETNEELDEIRQMTQEISILYRTVKKVKEKYDFDIETADQLIQSYDWYVTQRLDYGSTAENVINDLLGDGKTEWVAYDVEYDILGAWPGDVKVVLLSEDENIFSKTGKYSLMCIPLNEKRSLVDSKGFTSEVDVYEIVGESEAVFKDQKTLQDANDQISRLLRSIANQSEIPEESMSDAENEMVTENHLRVGSINTNVVEIAKDFIGSWEDNRCSLTVEDLGDGNVSVEIIWANGASEDSEWMMTGVPDADTGTMRYANGLCKNVEYLDNGTVSETILYENGEGYFFIQDGYLYWVDQTDHAGDNCRFERFSDSASAPVSTAETVIDPDTPYYSDEGDTMDVPHIMIENSSTEYLTDSDVYFYTPNQLRYAKNEIYARHGRRFNDAELQAWFDAQSWYSGTVAPEDFQESVLSAVEKANILVIQHRFEVNSQ